MKQLWSVLLAFVLAALNMVPAWALGDDVDYGGGYDSYDSYDTYDSYDSYDTYGYDYGNNYGNNYSYSTGTTSRSGSSASASRRDWILAIIGVLAIPAILIFSLFFAHYIPIWRKEKRTGVYRKLQRTRRVRKKSLESLRQHDPTFSAADVEATVTKWVAEFEDAWCGGDMTPLADCISDSLMDTYQAQLRMMRENGEVARSEDLAVLECRVEQWTQDGDKELLDVWLREKKRTYKVARENRDTLVKGNPSTMFYLDYRWQLMRPAKTHGAGGGSKPFGHKNAGWVLNKVDKLAQVNRRS